MELNDALREALTKACREAFATMTGHDIRALSWFYRNNLKRVR